MGGGGGGGGKNSVVALVWCLEHIGTSIKVLKGHEAIFGRFRAYQQKKCMRKVKISPIFRQNNAVNFVTNLAPFFSSNFRVVELGELDRGLSVSCGSLVSNFRDYVAMEKK